MRGMGILAAGAAVLALALSGSAVAGLIPLDRLHVNSDFTVAPKALPKRDLAPAGLRYSAQLPTAFESGEPAPPSKELVLLLDRNLSLDLDGYPVCSSEGLESQHASYPSLPKRCRRAVVGRGSANFLIRFPGSEPVAQSSRLSVVNGYGNDKEWTLYVHTELFVPVPAAIVSTVKIKPINKGRYGTQATMTIPKIAGGGGLLTEFSFELDKRFRRDGRWVSVVNAKCPGGKLQISTLAAFADGTRSETQRAKPCISRDG